MISMLGGMQMLVSVRPETDQKTDKVGHWLVRCKHMPPFQRVEM